MTRRAAIVLSQEQKLSGFAACIENATDLIGAAATAIDASAPAALAIAQIAQEELGKSMLLLVSATYNAEDDRSGFWRR